MILDELQKISKSYRFLYWQLKCSSTCNQLDSIMSKGSHSDVVFESIIISMDEAHKQQSETKKTYTHEKKWFYKNNGQLDGKIRGKN
jgi:hypothetical protein